MSGVVVEARVAPVWRGVVSAFCATLIGIGLARFAYTPLLPAIVGAGWFGASAAAWLGAANLGGYLAGALAGRGLAARAGTVAALRAAMVVAAVAFFACGFPVSYGWFFAWRFAAGVAGGVLMVLAAPTVLAHVPPARRGMAGGIIFMGVGAGVAASGTLVPLLLGQGLQAAWFGLGVLAVVLAGIGWFGWPGEAPAAPAAAPHAALPRAGMLRAVTLEYALNAAGWVPHMIFLVDFVARGLGQGVQVGAAYWVVFGIGATLGPLLAGVLADRTGFAAALRLGFLLETVAVAIPAVGPALGLGAAWLVASCLVMGAFVTGTVPLVLGRIHELLPHRPAAQKAAWSTATAAFALMQAAAAAGLSAVFAQTGSYALLFLAGTAAMVLALVVDLVAPFVVGRASA